MSRVVRIATRRSALAMWQANHVKGLLGSRYPDLDVRLVPMVTRGDRIIDRPLAEVGGKGLFLKELELAMLESRADLAVHSLKDVPADVTGGLVVDVFLPRADPRDAVVTRDGSGLAGLRPGAVVGTSSLRRQCQLRSVRPDLDVSDLRGNVDTRLRKLDDGQYDAIILACAGLERLGLGERISEALDPEAWLPAATQGIIALQYRTEDPTIAELLAPLNDATTARRAQAERQVAFRLEASCQLPVAAYCQAQDELNLHALVGTPDGKRIVRARGHGADPVRLGDEVAESLLSEGAAEIIAVLR